MSCITGLVRSKASSRTIRTILNRPNPNWKYVRVFVVSYFHRLCWYVHVVLDDLNNVFLSFEQRDLCAVIPFCWLFCHSCCVTSFAISAVVNSRFALSVAWKYIYLNKYHECARTRGLLAWSKDCCLAKTILSPKKWNYLRTMDVPCSSNECSMCLEFGAQFETVHWSSDCLSAVKGIKQL